MKKLISLIFVLFLISSVSAVLILMHPPNVEINGKVNERLCSKIIVFSDSHGNLTGKLRWTNLKYKINDIKQYNLNSSQLKINAEFPEKIVSNNKEKESEVCFTFENSGSYYGALTYSAENSPAGVGIWINANIKGEGLSGVTKFAGSVTGNIISITSKQIKNTKNLKFLFLISPTIFLIILLILVISYNKRMNSYYEEEQTSENSEKKKKSNTKK